VVVAATMVTMEDIASVVAVAPCKREGLCERE